MLPLKNHFFLKKPKLNCPALCVRNLVFDLLYEKESVCVCVYPLVGDQA